MTVEGEWLNGVPHGICIAENEELRGVMIFNNGKMDGLPGWGENKKDGTRLSYEYVDDKDPKGLVRIYYSDNNT